MNRSMDPGARSDHRFLSPAFCRGLAAPPRRLCKRVAVVLLTVFSASAPVDAQELPPDSLSHMREELGVNNFTAPPIDRLLRQLEALRPFGYDKLWREIPVETPSTRPGIALLTGVVIADGFLAVAAERPSRIEPCARALLRLTKGLGISDRLIRHGQSVIQLAANERWPAVKQELVRSQAEVEAALIALKDEEIAHLIALGGWVRGLEIVSTEILRDYTPDRARVLLQPEVLDYFADRLSTLNPSLQKQPVFQTLQKNTRELKEKLGSDPERKLSKEDVTEVQRLAVEMVDAIAGAKRPQ